MNKPKSIEEWKQIIEEARNSGMSDKDWCLAHDVSINTFYYNIRRLRAHACQVPMQNACRVTPDQAVVPLEIVDDNTSFCTEDTVKNTVISINCGGIRIDISNLAKSELVKTVVTAIKEDV